MVGLAGLFELVPVEALVNDTMGLLLSFPRFDPEVASERLQELEALEVTAIFNGGPLRLGDNHVLGRGHAGVVVKALCDVGHVALKIRRVDTARESMGDEAGFLEIANGVNVGPRLYRWSRNFLVMELVEGPMIVDWLNGLDPGDGESVRHLLLCLLLAARRLDEAGIDHGELSKAFKHVIVSGGLPRVIDFESASVSRRCANVTSLTQFLFLNSVLSGRLGRFMGLPDRGALLNALGVYKRSLSSLDFDSVLRVCGLL